MRPALFLLAAVVSTALADVSVKRLVFPTATSDSYVEMTPLKPLALTQFTLCMRVATELQGEREIILFAYRTQDYDALNVWRELDGRLAFYLSGEGAFFRLPEIGALQTHLCVAWDSNTGAANIFMDGKKSVTKIYKKGHRIPAGGKVLLGQDPDNYLGDFDAKQSFVGDIYDVNMWDYVLSDSTIQDVYERKGAPRGNVFDWESANLKLNGNVNLIQQDL